MLWLFYFILSLVFSLIWDRFTGYCHFFCKYLAWSRYPNYALICVYLRKIIFIHVLKRFILMQKKILFIHCICIYGNLISISWKYKKDLYFQVTIVFVCKLFMPYSCKRIYFVFSILIKSDFRLIWAINSFSSTILLYLSDERKEPILTIWSTQRERHAVWSLVDLKALVALQSISILKGAGSSVYLPFWDLIIFHWSKWNEGLEGGLHHWETGIFSEVP